MVMYYVRYVGFTLPNIDIILWLHIHYTWKIAFIMNLA